MIVTAMVATTARSVIATGTESRIAWTATGTAMAYLTGRIGVLMIRGVTEIGTDFCP